MYVVLEIQQEQDGTTRVLEPAMFEDKGDALQKYYLILQYAAKTTMRYHTATIMTPDGQVYKSECYQYIPPEPEPEPQPEPIPEEPVEEGETE